jgi:predicted nucleic acid-binding protein
VLVAVDTSVVVAATLQSLPFHARAKCWLDAIAAGEIDGAICAHALAESYSVLSRIPGGLLPRAAELVVAQLTTRSGWSR